MKVVDYWWIWPIVIVILLVVFWKPISSTFRGGSAKVFNKEGVEHGEMLFSKADKWAGPDFNRSCVMCHDPAYTPAAGVTIDMMDYDPENKVVLKDLKSKYRGGILSNNLLAEQVNRCIVMGTRMNGLQQHEDKDQDFVDLLAYLETL